MTATACSQPGGVKKRRSRLGEGGGRRLCVELRPAGAPHHLEHVRHREVDVPLRLAVVVLGPLDDDEVGGEVDAPREGRGADEDEDRLAEEELLDEDAVRLREAPNLRPRWPERSATRARPASSRPAWWIPIPKASVCRSAGSLTAASIGSSSPIGMLRNWPSFSSAEQ